MIKICYVTTIPLTIRSFFFEQLQYLSVNGFDVTVICSDDGKIKGELRNVNYIPIKIPRGLSFISSVVATWKLRRVFEIEKFDIIQYSTPNAALYASIAAKMVGCKIRNYHLMGFRYYGATGIGRKLLKTAEIITCRNSTSIECVSHSNMERGIQEGLFPKDKVSVIWNGSTGGVDLKRFDYKKRNQWRSEVRDELDYSKEDFIYGFVGRITKDKGINELLEAYLSLDTVDKLLLVGPMEGLNTLDQQLLTKANSNPNIRIHDAVTDIERYYAAIDVLILPSYREGFGNVVIEAGAVGTPAIVSNIPGPIDTIEDGKTALSFEVKNVADLAKKMKTIRKNDYTKMGLVAAQYAKDKFDSKTLCKKILERKLLLLETREN